jgi:biopolymer transport protein ExbD
MSKFRKKGKRKPQAISTASLPDIVFMLLIFFMVTTVMREVDLKVEVNLPKASEIVKLEKKSLVDYIYVGPPTDKRFGKDPRIQLDDSFAKVDDIKLFVEQKREQRQEAERSLITTSLKVNDKTEMGIITDIKQELRRAQALKLNYSSTEKERSK